jgi:hypothetical protein
MKRMMLMTFLYNYLARKWAKEELMKHGISEEESLIIIKKVDDQAKDDLKKAINNLGKPL